MDVGKPSASLSLTCLEFVQWGEWQQDTVLLLELAAHAWAARGKVQVLGLQGGGAASLKRARSWCWSPLGAASKGNPARGSKVALDGHPMTPEKGGYGGTGERPGFYISWGLPRFFAA